MKYISMLSGGRDSTVMTLMLLEKGERLDYIVFNDTGVEHEEMYEYIDKLDAFFQRKYGMKITRIHPPHTFDEYVWGLRSKGDNEGKRRGTPSIVDQCFWRRESKEYSFDRWLRKELGIGKSEKHRDGKIIQYVGFVFGEAGRVEAMPDFCEAPLYKWKIKEIDVQRYLEENEMENPLYKHFSRTGCALCPKQKLNDKYLLYKHYPKVWAYMKDTEKRLNEDEKRVCVISRWHTTMYIEDMEREFRRRDKQSTFEFEEEEVRDCFCKI